MIVHIVTWTLAPSLRRPHWWPAVWPYSPCHAGGVDDDRLRAEIAGNSIEGV